MEKILAFIYCTCACRKTLSRLRYDACVRSHLQYTTTYAIGSHVRYPDILSWHAVYDTVHTMGCQPTRFLRPERFGACTATVHDETEMNASRLGSNLRLLRNARKRIHIRPSPVHRIQLAKFWPKTVIGFQSC